MIDAREQRAEEIFVAALEAPHEERAAFVATSCAGDALLFRRVKRLLACHEQGTAFLESPAALDGAMSGAARDPDLLIGRRIGRYTIQERLGEGGMAIVYKALQDQPRRTVAMKVLKSAWARSARRFASEAQVLARMHHPGIAQVYEAGDDDGRSSGVVGGVRYFVMEFVEGRPIAEHAERAELGTAARLGLLLQVCDAVQYAHEQGVIHRDLKPANIIVTPGGAPKVLDFGVAHVLEESGAGAVVTTVRTSWRQIVGTLAYMSPEQMTGGAVDGRSDVYSLGVMLFELLSGRLPYDLHGRAAGEAIRMVTQEDPTRLSSISRSFRGDVDAIVSKALEKEPARRYASVAAMAEDLRRHLRHQPIAARPVSTLSQVRKFAGRNRGLVTGLAAAFVALTIGLMGTTWEAVAAIRSREQALKAEHRTQAAYDLLTSVLEDDPTEGASRFSGPGSSLPS